MTAIAPGLALSRLALGSVAWGRTEGLKYLREPKRPSDQALLSLLTHAVELGINLIDTAPAYGDAEQRLGEWLPRFGDHFRVSTKVGEQFIGGVSQFDFSAKATQSSIENSLRLLKRDRLEIALVHSDGSDLDILRHSDCIETLTTLQRRGDIAVIGFSAKSLEGALAALCFCDVLMLEFNALNQSLAQAFTHAAAMGKSVLVKKPLASGHLHNDALAANFALLHSMPAIASVVVGTTDLAHLRQVAQYF